jgi:hypothetical protein
LLIHERLLWQLATAFTAACSSSQLVLTAVSNNDSTYWQQRRLQRMNVDMNVNNYQCWLTKRSFTKQLTPETLDGFILPPTSMLSTGRWEWTCVLEPLQTPVTMAVHGIAACHQDRLFASCKSQTRRKKLDAKNYDTVVKAHLLLARLRHLR